MSENKEVQQSVGNEAQVTPAVQQANRKKKPNKRMIIAIVLLVLYSVVLVFATVKIDRAVLAKRMEKAFSSAFDESEEDTTQADSKKGKKVAKTKLTADELEAKLAEQPVVVKGTSVLVQSDEYKSLYPDLLSAVIQNNSGIEIKSVTVGFVAWDENNLPVKIAGKYDYGDGMYFQQVAMDDVNLIDGATYGEKSGMGLDDNHTIKTAKAIIISYTDFDGNTWENPLLEDFKAIYENQKLV